MYRLLSSMVANSYDGYICMQPEHQLHQEVGAGYKSRLIKGQDSNDGRVLKDAKSHIPQGYKTDKTPCVKWASERARRGLTEIRASLLHILHTRRERERERNLYFSVVTGTHYRTKTPPDQQPMKVLQGYDETRRYRSEERRVGKECW